MIRVPIMIEGQFRLSDAAILACVEKGMTLDGPLAEGEHRLRSGFDFYTDRDPTNGKLYNEMGGGFDKSYRTNPIVLSVIDRMGDEAFYQREDYPAKVKVVEIPFAGIDGWHICDYETCEGEYIAEDYRTWE